MQATAAGSSPSPPAPDAHADWPRLKGHWQKILGALHQNITSPLYAAKLVTLVRTEDKPSLRALESKGDPVWTQAKRDAEAVHDADEDFDHSSERPAREGLAEYLGDHINSRDKDPAYEAELFSRLSKDQLQDVAKFETTNDLGAKRAFFGQALSSAEAGGGIAASDVAGMSGAAWADNSHLPKGRRAPDDARGVVQHNVVDAQAAIDRAQQNFANASKGLAKLDAACNEQIHDISAALGVKEIRKYREQFRKVGDYPAAVSAQAKAATELQQAMTMYSPQLETFAADHRRGGATEGQVCSNYRALASTTTAGAQQAMRWVIVDAAATLDRKHLVVTTPKPAFAGHANWLDEIMRAAQRTVQREALEKIGVAMQAARSPEDGWHAAWKSLDEGYLEPFEDLHDVAGIAKVKDLYRELQDEKHGKLFDPRTKKPTPLLSREIQRLTRLGDTDAMTNKIVSGFSDMVSVFTFSGNLADGRFEQALEHVRDMADSAQELAKLVTNKSTGGNAEKLERMKKLKALCGGIAHNGSGLSRMLPFLGMAQNAAATTADLAELLKHPKEPFRYAEVIGDFVSTVGSALELMPPPLDLAGALMNVAGAAISGAASFFMDLLGLDDERSKAEQKHSILDAIDPDHPVRNKALSSDIAPADLNAAKAAGIKQQDLAHLVGEVPDMFTMRKDAVSALLTFQNKLVDHGFNVEIYGKGPQGVTHSTTSYQLRAMSALEFLRAMSSGGHLSFAEVLAVALHPYDTKVVAGPDGVTYPQYGSPIETLIGTRELYRNHIPDKVKRVEPILPASDFNITSVAPR